MGVVLAHDFPDNAGTLVERTLRAVTAVKHGVQHAAVHGLQPIPNVREGAAHDNGHGVVQV